MDRDMDKNGRNGQGHGQEWTQWTGTWTRMDAMDIMDTNGHVFYGQNGHVQQVMSLYLPPAPYASVAPLFSILS